MTHPLYTVVRAIVIGFCRVFFRLRIDGLENVPASGSFVISPVHRSNIDFALVAAIARRRLRYMGKDSLWRVPLLGPFISALGAFPVRRGAPDREALRRCIAVIEDGEPLVMFPEGTRQSGPDVQPLFDGAAYVAGRTGVPILPIGIGGSERAMPRGSKMIRPVRVHMVIGKPIDPPATDEGGRIPRRAIRETTATLKTEIQSLFDEAQRKVG